MSPPNKTRLISTTIKGDIYALHTLPMSEGLLSVMELAKLIAAGYDPMAQDVDVSGLLKAMAECNAVAWIKLMLRELTKNDLEVDPEEEFSANYGVLVQLLKWSCLENFQSFFDGAPTLQKLAAMGKTKLRATLAQAPAGA